MIIIYQKDPKIEHNKSIPQKMHIRVLFCIPENYIARDAKQCHDT